jgi:transcriptional regulator with XRE-family HTH domain
LWTSVTPGGILDPIGASKSLSPPQVFGQRLRELRQRRGWTQAQLGKKAGFERTTITKIENGTRGDVSISQLFKFAEVLGTSPIFLLTPENPLHDVQLSPGGQAFSGWEVRRWIRGMPAPGASVSERYSFYSDLPKDELVKLLTNPDPLDWPIAFLAGASQHEDIAAAVVKVIPPSQLGELVAERALQIEVAEHMRLWVEREKENEQAKKGAKNRGDK